MKFLQRWFLIKTKATTTTKQQTAIKKQMINHKKNIYICIYIDILLLCSPFHLWAGQKESFLFCFFFIPGTTSSMTKSLTWQRELVKCFCETWNQSQDQPLPLKKQRETYINTSERAKKSGVLKYLFCLDVCTSQTYLKWKTIDFRTPIKFATGMHWEEKKNTALWDPGK